jgi:hypothetical protein
MMNKVVFGLALSLSLTAAAHAGCPDGRKAGGIQPQDVQQFLDEVKNYSDGETQNKRIQSCVRAEKRYLTLDEFSAMHNALANEGYGDTQHWTSQATSDRIIDSYFDARKESFKPADAVSLSQAMSDENAGNDLLESYSEARLASLSWTDVQTVVKGLRGGSPTSTFGSTRHEGSTVGGRIYVRFFDARLTSMDPTLALAVAQSNDGDTCNKLIEKYFRANLKTLNWDQAQQLMAGLSGSTQSTRHAAAATKDRMTARWQRK